MRTRKRAISIFMLLIFGLLSLKSVLRDLDSDFEENCQEFGHIHHFHLKGFMETQGADLSFDKFLDRPAEDCHEGKLALTFASLPACNYDLEISNDPYLFELVFNLKSHFKNPFLEPHRRPPKSV